MNKELIEFVFNEAQQNVKTHIESLAVLRAEANTTLGLLTAAAGAALGYAIKLMEENGDFAVRCGLIAIAVFLAILCALTLWKCLCADDVMPAHCEPKNLYHPAYDVTAIKEVELDQLQVRCDFNRDKTWKMAWWLNLIRALILFTPSIFFVARAVAE